MSQNSWKGVSVFLSSIGSDPRQGAAPSGISPRWFSLVSCGPGSWRTPTPACLGSAWPTTFWWRSLFSYSSPLESFCEWWRDCKQELSGLDKRSLTDVIVSYLLCICWKLELISYCLFFFSFFRMVIYLHTQVVDGQRRIISRLEKQIENVCISNWTFFLNLLVRGCWRM